MPPQEPTVWKRGSTVEVAAGIAILHSGGWSYRLCRADTELTEECFQQRPLPFVGVQHLQYPNGTRQLIPSKYAYANGSVAALTADGQLPTGATWALNPIPRINWGSSRNPAGSGSCGSVPRDANCTQFPPPCAEGIWNETGRPLPWYRIEKDALADDVEGYCSGDWTDGRIVDRVLVPPSLPKGDYVLGWRWDCEETTQVWQNCADVRIV